jgi:hypothetical protein
VLNDGGVKGRFDVIAFAIAPEQVRLVFHLDVDDEGTQRTMEALKRTLA